MKILANFSRLIVGMYLIFSGFLKVVDPYGTALKLKEYFEVFAMDVPAMEGFFETLAASSVTLSVIVCCLEWATGAQKVQNLVEDARGHGADERNLVGECR